MSDDIEQLPTRLAGRPALVTGGAGFIGSHLTDSLLGLGVRVRVLDDFSTGQHGNLEAARAAGGDRIEVIEGDIRDAAVCRRAASGAGIVFHQAALGSVPRSMKDPATTVSVNLGGTANVLAAARDAGARRVVYASSSSVYGSSETLPKREGEEGEPISPYAASKKMGEELAQVFARCFGLEPIGLRYFNVYGPRQDPAGAYAAVIPRFFHALLAGEPPTVYGDGEQSRDFTYVADAVAANLRAAVAPPQAAGHAYNVAAGARTSINELAEKIRDAVGGPAPRYAPPRPGDVRDSLADLTRSRQALGYAPVWSLDRGLEAAAVHYRRTAD